MARKRHKRGFSWDDVPLTSFSDIAFLLIIFFILAATLAQTRGLTTDFPQGEKSEEPPKKTTSIMLRDGRVLFNDKPVDLAKLKAELALLRLGTRKGDAQVVLLEATGKVAYQTYFEVMAAITKAGGKICIVREEGS